MNKVIIVYPPSADFRPEMWICNKILGILEELNIKVINSVGGDKIQSSSFLLKNVLKNKQF